MQTSFIFTFSFPRNYFFRYIFVKYVHLFIFLSNMQISSIYHMYEYVTCKTPNEFVCFILTSAKTVFQFIDNPYLYKVIIVIWKFLILFADNNETDFILLFCSMYSILYNVHARIINSYICNFIKKPLT